MIKPYQERFVKIENRVFTYSHVDEKSSDTRGYLNFDLYSCRLKTDRDNELVFEIKVHGNDRVFTFKAPNPKTYQKVVHVIGESIKISAGFQKGFRVPDSK